MENVKLSILNLSKTSNTKKAEKTLKGNRRLISIVFYTIILISIIGLYINIKEWEINLFPVVVYVIPLLVFSYYYVFYKNQVKYNTLDNVVLLGALVLFVSSLLLNSFVGENVYFVFAQNILIVINTLFIVRTFIEYIYYKLISNVKKTFKRYTKKVNLTIKFEDSSNAKELLSFVEKLELVFISIDKWLILSEGNIGVRELSYPLDVLLKLHEYQISLYSNYSILAEDTKEHLHDLFLEYEMSMFNIISIINSSRLNKAFVYYLTENLKVSMKANDYDLFKDDMHRYLFEYCEVFIQKKDNDVFNEFVSFFVNLIIDEFEEKNLINERLKAISKTLYMVINTIRKYIDNIDTLSGKFILQTISKYYETLKNYDDDEVLDSFLFLLVDILSSKDNSNNSVIIYYQNLETIVNNFDDNRERLDFYTKIINRFTNYKESLSMLVFHNISQLNKNNIISDEEIVGFFIEVHTMFDKDVINHNDEKIVDFILNGKLTDDVKKVLDNLSMLYAEYTNHSNRFFGLLDEMLSADKLTVYDFLLKNERYWYLIEEISVYSHLNNNDSEPLKSILMLHSRISVKEVHTENIGDSLDFYKKTIEHIDSVIKVTNEDEVRKDLIEWIGYLVKNRLYRSEFEYTMKKLYEIGLYAMQSGDERVLEYVSDQLGWTQFRSFSTEKIKERAIKDGFTILLKYYLMICEYSYPRTKVFVGTAITTNYIKSRVENDEFKGFVEIETKLKNAISSNEHEQRSSLLKALRLKEDTLENYFDDDEKAKSYSETLKTILSN